MCSAEIFLETIQSIESILTQFRDINMRCQNVIFQKTKDGAQPRKFLKNRTIWHYFENISTNILRCYCMINC